MFSPGLLERFVEAIGQLPLDQASMQALAREQTEAGRKKIRRSLTSATASQMPQYLAAHGSRFSLR